MDKYEITLEFKGSHKFEVEGSLEEVEAIAHKEVAWANQHPPILQSAFFEQIPVPMTWTFLEAQPIPENQPKSTDEEEAPKEFERCPRCGRDSLSEQWFQGVATVSCHECDFSWPPIE